MNQGTAKMENRVSRIIIFLIIVLSIFHSGKALKCYTCVVQNTKCEKPPFEEMQCAGNETLCTKFEVELADGKTMGIGRVCAISGFCENKAKQLGYVKTCHKCSIDLCNASANNVVSIIIIITSGLITLLWTIQ